MNETSILRDKTAVMTGSTCGIGLACARAFAGAGANIVLNGMGAAADIEKARSAIEADFGVKVIHSSADMAKPRDIAEMIALGEKTFGSVDVLVNNAGVQHVSPIEEFPIEKLGCDHRDQSVLRLSCYPRSCSRHEKARLGPYHHDGLGPLARRVPFQVGLRGRQARYRGSHQDRCAGAREVEDHLQLH